MTNLEINVEFGKCSLKGTGEEAISETYEVPVDLKDIRSGNLYFGKHQSNTKHMPFILAHHTSSTDKIIQKMFDEWELPSPRIVVITVAETEDSPSDEYRKYSHKLIKGLLHALNTTEMWLCTNGLNHGFSKDIGTAFGKELSRRNFIGRTMRNTSSVFPETALIGVNIRQNLSFSGKLDPQEKTDAGTGNKNNINKHHGYFLFVEDSSETNKGMFNFLQNFTSQMRKTEDYVITDEPEIALGKSETPVMILLLQGKITQIDLILGYIKCGLPIVVFEGSGGLADLIAYAYHQLTYQPEGINEAEYAESVLKPQLSDIMRELYPDFPDIKIFFLAEKIFDCIRYSKVHDQEIITVLDLTDVEITPSSLSSYLLKAHFKSEPLHLTKDVRQMVKDLCLSMDWNSPIIAKEEVFDRYTDNCGGKFQIGDEMFFRALTRPHREEFVSLFINQGFVIHSFLDSKNLLRLFQYSLNREFFRSVVWENVLGFGASSEISRSFVDRTLINLIEELTGIPSLINSYELDWNSNTMYEDRTPEEAERKAMAALAMWAILSYRAQLVKTIWRHCEQPIHLALTCCIILQKLETSVTDLNVKNEMIKQSKEFSEMAASVMTLCYDSVPPRAINLLKEKNRVWSCIALMELAAFAKNKQFLAHSSCQKYLDNMFMGYIKVKDLPYGDITIPLWLKIVLSLFLVFPIFLWIRFEVPDQSDIYEESESDDVPEEQDQSLTEKQNVEQDQLTKKQPQPPFLRRLYYFWSAPITKFWVCQVFYLLFLILFSIAVIWPSCGNIFLDFFTCVWLATIIIDSIYETYTLHMKYSSMPLMYKVLEISLMTLFLFLYVMGRIVWRYSFMTPYTAKVILCIALLYFYYRFIFIALPISSELGPLLYRVRRMTTVDFFDYMRVTSLVIISNGIAIHAVVFPDYPLNWELIRKAFFDAITAFFLLPISDYVGSPNPKCIRLMRHPNKMSFIGFPPEMCKVGRYLKPECPNPGVWPYLFGFQYMIILRLILVVMLFALFSNTAKKLEEEGKYIWKYQRYPLVINFANRLTLPPPLSFLTLIYLLIKHLFYCFCNFLNRYVKYAKLKGFSRQDISAPREKLNETDFTFWKNLAMQYYKKKKQEKNEEITTGKRMEQVNALRDDLNKQRRAIRNLEGHLNEILLLITNAHQYLKGTRMKVSIRERLEAKNVQQIFSRISPYPNTMVARFPVSDNHVPWDVNWTRYDPVSITFPKGDYPPDLRPYVDVDIQRMREDEGDEFRMPNFNWNVITVTPGDVVNRESWITDKSGQTSKYKLDSERLPRNPLGRTGLKGRGRLPRWGPNHYIYVVITKIHEQEDLLFQYTDAVLLSKNGRFNLPGGYVHTEKRYEIIRSLFDTEETWQESKDMISFFKSLKTITRNPVWKKAKEKIKEEDEFTAEKVQYGYMDEETNTDQAWCEAEVWHIHYNIESDVKQRLKVEADWHLLTYEILQKIPAGQASILHKIAKKMKAALEEM